MNESGKSSVENHDANVIHGPYGPVNPVLTLHMPKRVCHMNGIIDMSQKNMNPT